MARLSEEDYGYDSGSYLDSRDFKAYKQLIRDTIHKAGRPVSIGEIHAALGDRAKREWTADALDLIADIEVASTILPTRYRPLTRLIKGLHKTAAERFELKPPKAKGPDWFDYDQRVRSF